MLPSIPSPHQAGIGRREISSLQTALSGALVVASAQVHTPICYCSFSTDATMFPLVDDMMKLSSGTQHVVALLLV